MISWRRARRPPVFRDGRRYRYTVELWDVGVCPSRDGRHRHCSGLPCTDDPRATLRPTPDSSGRPPERSEMRAALAGDRPGPDL